MCNAPHQGHMWDATRQNQMNGLCKGSHKVWVGPAPGQTSGQQHHQIQQQQQNQQHPGMPYFNQQLS
eukprot:11913828-Ditylum_brightwellii.AAC.1